MTSTAKVLLHTQCPGRGNKSARWLTFQTASGGCIWVAQTMFDCRAPLEADLPTSRPPDLLAGAGAGAGVRQLMMHGRTCGNVFPHREPER